MNINKTSKLGMSIALMASMLYSSVGCGDVSTLTASSSFAKTQAQSVKTTKFTKSSLIPNQYLVRFKANVKEAVITATLKKLNARLLRYSSALNVRQIQAADTSFVERIKNEKIVESIESNHRYTASFTVNDPRSSEQKGIATVNIAKAWDITLGSKNIVIGIVDTGVDLKHPDLASKIVTGYNVLTDGKSSPEDDNGHGTHVSGIAAAATDNKIGIAGTAPKCMIMPVKALDKDGGGDALDIAIGIVWAVDHGANVINMSLGGPVCTETLERSVQYALIHRVPVVSATGNGNEEGIGINEPRYPAALTGVIAVGSMGSTGEVSRFSNYGKWTTVLAPGEQILSTTPTYSLPGIMADYDYMDGTSMACPIVAGVVGLMLSRNPNMTPAMVKAKLQSTAKPIGSTGFNEKAGYGLVDAEKAVL